MGKVKDTSAVDDYLLKFGGVNGKPTTQGIQESYRMFIYGVKSLPATDKSVMVTLGFANDDLTQQDIQNGKGRTVPILNRNFIIPKTKLSMILSKCNTDGDRPVMDGRLISNNLNLRIDMASISKPYIEFSEALHNQNTEAVKNVRKNMTPEQLTAVRVAQAKLYAGCGDNDVITAGRSIPTSGSSSLPMKPTTGFSL